ncbi:MAG: hypothetical protein M3Q11_06705 [Pseudomonadota bacterium]|nr:hypothetical protein [Pseudomonadota bacterium]
MNKFLALCYFALSLYGFDVGGNALMHREPGETAIARLQCLGSDGAHCRYILFPRIAAPTRDRANAGSSEHCRPRPLDRFAIALGADHPRPVIGLLGLHGTAAATHTKAGCATPASAVP